MLSLTSQYALRAMIHLAQNEESWPIPGKQIAAQAGVPAKYLSKVLGDLARAGVLDSSPGKTGGFSMRRDPRETTLFEVLTPFETFNQQRCPFGNQACSDQNPCLAHAHWKKVLEAQLSFMSNTSVYDVAFEARPKKASPRRRSAKK